MTRPARKVVDIRDDAASDELATALDIGHVPPANLDAEGVVLSACLMAPRAADSAPLAAVREAGLKPEHFYSEANGRLFNALLATCGDLRPAADAVVSWLRAGGSLSVVGGSAYLAQLADCTPARSLPALRVDAAEVIEKAKQRRLLAAMQAVAVKMRHGELSHEGARKELRRHFEECK